MKTETQLVLDHDTALELAKELRQTATLVKTDGSCRHVRKVLEQTEGGPWRLILTVISKED